MQDYLTSMAFSVLFEVLNQSFKSVQARAKWRRALTKLRDRINLVLDMEDGTNDTPTV